MQETCLHPLKIQAELEEQYSNLRPLSADKRFNYNSTYKERRSIACAGAEKSAPAFRKLSEFRI